jgi:hypothetical protein
LNKVIPTVFSKLSSISFFRLPLIGEESCNGTCPNYTIRTACLLNFMNLSLEYCQTSPIVNRNQIESALLYTTPQLLRKEMI